MLGVGIEMDLISGTQRYQTATNTRFPEVQYQSTTASSKRQTAKNIEVNMLVQAEVEAVN